VPAGIEGHDAFGESHTSLGPRLKVLPINGLRLGDAGMVHEGEPDPQGILWQDLHRLCVFVLLSLHLSPPRKWSKSALFVGDMVRESLLTRSVLGHRVFLASIGKNPNREVESSLSSMIFPGVVRYFTTRLCSSRSPDDSDKSQALFDRASVYGVPLVGSEALHPDFNAVRFGTRGYLEIALTAPTL
jgi:hypothetical protein